MDTKALLEGALFAGINVVMAAIGITLPLLGNILLLLTPLPFIILAVRWGSQLSILASIVSTVILMVLLGPQFFLVSLIFSGLVGVSMGAAFEEGFSPHKVLIIGTLAVVVSFGLNLAITVYLLKFDILAQFASSLEFSADIYRQFGVSNKLVEQITTKLIDLIKNTYLILFLCSGLFISSFNYYFSVKLLTRIKDFDYPTLTFLEKFKLPRLAVIIYLFSLFFGGVIWQNIYILATFLLMIEGGTLAFYFQEKINKFLVVIGVLLLPILLQILLFVGIADVWFDFRNLEGDTEE